MLLMQSAIEVLFPYAPTKDKSQQEHSACENVHANAKPKEQPIVRSPESREFQRNFPGRNAPHCKPKS
jgi:hypothetical protein